MSKRSSEIKEVKRNIQRRRKLFNDYRELKPYFTKDDAILISKALKIDFDKEKFSVDEFWKGVNVELEHGSKFPELNVTKNDPILTGKIALAHLKEFPDYYERLSKLEEEAIMYWSEK